jgi:o-succinylbenzoate---CoA ligase
VKLSITAAAREVPDRLALITSTASYTFADLCSLALAPAPAPARSLIAHPTVDTLLAIYAALETKQPITLVHPRAPFVPDIRALPPGTLAVLFTSGTTAAPRGVVLSRAAFLASATASESNLGDHDDDRWLLCLPLAHAGGLGVALRALAARRPLVFHDGPFEPSRVLQLARDHRVTLASLVPTQLDALLATGAPLPPWRAVLLGGAAAPAPLLARAAARGVPFLRTYGLTETWGQVATQRLADAGRPDAPLVPMPGLIVHGGTLAAPAPIAIHGATVMTGYLGEPPLRGPLVTSDLGWIDATGLHVIGRADDVIITGGENVHPAQVEAALAGAPGVAAAVAFGIPDERWGQLVACAVVPAASRGDDRVAWLGGLHSWLATHLPPQLRPRRLAVVDALPLLPSGKIDRRALAEQLRPA